MKGSSKTSTAGRVAGQRPDDVDRPLGRLVVKLRRRTAELHGRVALDLDAVAGRVLDPVGPHVENMRRHIRLRRQEMVQPERHLLRQRRRRTGQPRRRSQHTCGKRRPETLHLHRFPP
jgi:hypothetical protein